MIDWIQTGINVSVDILLVVLLIILIKLRKTVNQRIDIQKETTDILRKDIEQIEAILTHTLNWRKQ